MPDAQSYHIMQPIADLRGLIKRTRNQLIFPCFFLLNLNIVFVKSYNNKNCKQNEYKVCVFWVISLRSKVVQEVDLGMSESSTEVASRQLAYFFPTFDFSLEMHAGSNARIEKTLALIRPSLLREKKGIFYFYVLHFMPEVSPSSFYEWFKVVQIFLELHFSVNRF